MAIQDDIEQNKQEISQLENKIQSLESELREYRDKFQTFIDQFKTHNHTGSDGSSILSYGLDLKPEQLIKMGYGGIGTAANLISATPGSTGEQIQMAIASGKDLAGGFGTTTKNLQLNLLHQPQNTSNQSFITAIRPPFYSTFSGSTITTVSAGTTVTVIGYNFVTNSLAGALISVYSSSGTLIETQTIASNTATVITISGTWLASTAGGSYQIYQPVFLGSADTIWQRFYTQEGTGGGIRFGVGVTNGGQNGLLYSDAAGDLYWRNKAGTSTKLN